MALALLSFVYPGEIRRWLYDIVSISVPHNSVRAMAGIHGRYGHGSGPFFKEWGRLASYWYKCPFSFSTAAFPSINV